MAPRWSSQGYRAVSLVLVSLVLMACAAPAGPSPLPTPLSTSPRPVLSATPDLAVGPTATTLALPANGAATPTVTAASPTSIWRVAFEPVELLWATDGTPHPFGRPFDLAVDRHGSVYVLVSESHRVQKYDRAGRFVTMWGSRGDGPGQFDFPESLSGVGGIAVDAQGDVYVSDGNHRVQRFTPTGALVTTWGSQGTGDGQFQSPAGLEIDRHGHVYVADKHNHRVQKFDRGGAFLHKWGSPGTGDGEFLQSWGVAVDQQDHVYVSDASGRIQKFDGQGRFLTAWGGRGANAGEFGRNIFLTVDGQGIVYAADQGNHRVQVFNSHGSFLGQWGSHGRGDGQFDGAGGIAVDGQGHIHTCSILGQRVQKVRARVNWLVVAYGTPTPRPTTVPPRRFVTPTDR